MVQFCPSSDNNPSSSPTYEPPWHQSLRSVCSWTALMGSLACVVSALAASHQGMLAARLAWILALLGPVALSAICLHLYCLRVRAKFKPLRTSTGSEKTALPRAIPVHGLFATVSEIVLRRSTLLRNIDLERMKKHGDIYLMFAGPLPVIVVTSSSLVEKISKDYHVFAKSDPRALDMPYYFKWVGSSNVVLANGDQWHRIRQLTHPALNSVHVFSTVFNDKARFLCQALREKVAASTTADGMSIPLTRWLKAVSLDSAGAALFGFEFKHLQELSNPGIAAMDYVIAEVFDPARMAFPLKNRLPLESNQKLEKCMKHLDQLVLDMIASIRQEEDEHERGNVLKMLIHGQRCEALNTSELRNNIIAMVLASHETTQVSLGGVLYFMARYPALQEKLRNESIALFPDLDQAFSHMESGNQNNSTYRKLRNFHSLGNFILESLRLYSPLANQNPRTTSSDTELGGYRIPKGTLVSMNIHAIHMNPKEWDRPEDFNPDRFAGESCENKFAYLPFGAGPRLCAGRNFTLMEQKIVLCHLLRHFDISLPHSGYKVPIRRGSFTGLPENSFELHFRLRAEMAPYPAAMTGVTIYSAHEPLPEEVKPCILSVSYPGHWFAPLPLSPYAATIEEKTMEWMDSLGLVRSTQRRARLLAMEPRHYAGYSHSMASYEHALMYCKYITMWLLWDDECVEVATDHSEIAAPLMALAGENVPSAKENDPYVRAFKHIAMNMSGWALHATGGSALRQT